MKDKAKSTKDRLLSTAEQLYAENGIEATSLRRITELAEANLAAVNYHFGTKDALTEAVFARRLAPLNEARLKLLDEAEAAAGPSPPTIESILRAFLIPTLHLWQDAPHFLRLGGRLQYEPSEKLHDIFLSQFEEVIRRFDAALTKAFPGVHRRELFWRMHFVVGAMFYTWTCHSDLERVSGGMCKVTDYGELVDRLVAFGAAGFRAPFPAPAAAPAPEGLA